MPRRDHDAALAARDFQYGRAGLTRRFEVAPARVGAVLDKLVEQGMVACRPGRRPRYEIDWNRFAPWFARMALGPDTRESANVAGLPEPKLEIEVGEWGGWHPVVVWHPRSAQLKAPRLIGDLGRHPAFHDLLERFLVRLREDAGHDLMARSRYTLSDLASAFEVVLLQSGPRLTADANPRAKALVRMLKQWNKWRTAAHSLSEQGWLDSIEDLKILAPERSGIQ
jgi:hypothetical protein